MSINENKDKIKYPIRKLSIIKIPKNLLVIVLPIKYNIIEVIII